MDKRVNKLIRDVKLIAPSSTLLTDPIQDRILHLHALYKLPEKYQGNDQQFIQMATKVWPAALGISQSYAKGINPLKVSIITAESYKNKVNYVAEKIIKTDSPAFLSHEATRIIKRCNSFREPKQCGIIS